MIGSNKDWDKFITDHRWAVLTTLRETGQPNSSVVAYARRDDLLVISTPGGTFKTQTIQRDPRVNLTVLSNAEPFNFVAIEAQATVTQNNLVADTKKVFASLDGTDYAEPEDLEHWLQSQARVILQLQPTRVYGVIR